MLEKFTLQPFEHSNMDFHNNLLKVAFTDYTLLSGYIDDRFWYGYCLIVYMQWEHIDF